MNAIAHTYREAKSLPIKQYSEAFTFFHVLASVDGLVVLDVACGDGYYTRALKRQGASRVLGVDSSHRMITYATCEEEAHPLGIEYVVGEAETMDILGAFDLVTAAYLLVHATTRSQLAAMCQAIGKQLKPGGRCVALTINPHLMIDQLPRIEQYQAGVTVHGPLYEGAPLDITMLTACGPVHIRILWFWKPRKACLRQDENSTGERRPPETSVAGNRCPPRAHPLRQAGHRRATPLVSCTGRSYDTIKPTRPGTMCGALTPYM